MQHRDDEASPDAVPRALLAAGRVSLGLLALGFTILIFGLAVGIGARIEGGGRTPGAAETVLVRDATGRSEAASREQPPRATSDSPAAPSHELLRGFHEALRGMAAGRRNRPVTVLHMGDAHVSGDRLDAHLRALMQSRFGDAGRSMLLPSGVIKGLRARGLRLDATAGWTGVTALDPNNSVLGLTGVQATATSAQAELAVAALDGRFDAAEVSFLAGPDKGAATILIDGRAHQVVTRAAETSVQRARLPTAGEVLSVKPSGTGPITVMSVSLHKNRPGVRYAAIGLPGGGIDAVERLDELVLVDDLRTLRPDLVILGYGATEALDDRLDIARYRERYGGLLRLLKRILPEASFVVMAPGDINRVPDFAARARGLASTGCRALSPQEAQEHEALLAAGDERLARWYPPPRLDYMRSVLQQVSAQAGAYYWDWSRIMGGACGMHAWVHSKPELALPDHFLLTDEGYQRSARALLGDLLQGYTDAPAAPQTVQAAPR